MPVYTVTDPRSNKTIELTGDSPPSEQELNQIFAKLNTPEAPRRTMGQAIGQTAADVGIGAAKGAANTAIGLGDLFNRYVPGVHQLSEAINGSVAPDTFQKARQVFATPTNTPQKIGFGGEQIGEFFIPTGAAGKIGQAAEVGKSAGLTMAQGGTPGQAAASGAITAAVPVVGAVAKKASGLLQRGAEKEMAQALGATKEAMKAQARNIAPEMLDRGVKGSRTAMLNQASEKVAEVGGKIGAETTAAAAAGKTISGEAVRTAMWKATAPLTVLDAKGNPAVINGAEPVMRRIEKLDSFIESLGPDIPVDKAAKIKTAFDRIVSKSGLYGQKAAASATDNANAWAIREAASSFRDLLASSNPTIADLNKEYAFWKGLKTVLTETERRTQAQAGTGLVAAGSGGVGAAIGAMSGDSYSDRAKNAVIGGIAARQLVKVLSSPAWRTTVAGPLKAKLADALASGSAEHIGNAIGKITASIPAQMREAPVTP